MTWEGVIIAAIMGYLFPSFIVIGAVVMILLNTTIIIVRHLITGDQGADKIARESGAVNESDDSDSEVQDIGDDRNSQVPYKGDDDHSRVGDNNSEDPKKGDDTVEVVDLIEMDLTAITTTVTANRDGSPSSADEDGVLSVNASLAKDAAVLFQARKFDECLGVLHQLLEKKNGDPKILHNIAIVEFFRDDCSDPKKLLAKLNNVKKRSQELACASREQVDSVSNTGNKMLVTKGSGGAAQQMSILNSGAKFYNDETDASVAALNTAIVWYHLHDYEKALSILEPLYFNIQPIDETTALHICLLLLVVLLSCRDATRSLDVLNYLERAFGVGCLTQGGDNANSVHQPSADILTKSSSVPNSSSPSDGANLDLGGALESPLSRTFSEETLETMLSSLDLGGGQNFTNQLRSQPDNRSLSTVDLKFKLQLYKVKFLLLTRNLKLAKREAKHAMNIARGRDSSMALLLKSQLEFARGNYHKAIKLLNASSNRTETAISSMIQNNLGCIYYQLGKYHTSLIFFSKALNNCSTLRKEKPRNLLAISQDNSLLITYNCGMQYLACGKPIPAAACFQKASLVFYNRPLLWLRFAESCIMALEKGISESGNLQSDRSEIRVRVIGKGKWRQLVTDGPDKDARLLGSNGLPKLSMSVARQCLLTALHLLEKSESDNLDPKASNVPAGQVTSNGDVKEQKLGSNLETMQNSVSLYEDIRKKENRLLKQAVLAYLAYVQLELDNPLKSLSNSKSLLELPDCSRIYAFLAHVYAAEALCLLNKPNEAAEHLAFYISGVNSVESPFTHDDFEKWRFSENPVDSEEAFGKSKNSQGITFLSPEEARGALFANIAAMSAMQGDLLQASQFIGQALTLTPSCPKAILTGVYVDLRLGKVQEALTNLKQCSHIRFLPSNVVLNKSS
ncbi:hypothetical protein ACFE04_001221 [Oxalis oulophora]